MKGIDRGRSEMEGCEQTNKSLLDLIEIIHFIENVSAKIHEKRNEVEIYRTVKEEFGKSKQYNASILLLTDGGKKLRIAETSLALRKLKAGESVSGLRLKEHKIGLNNSSIYSKVIREGKTFQANASDIIGEWIPRSLAQMISKITGYEKRTVILTPLKRHGKIIGALAISSTILAEHFIPSVKNLAQHISNALELAHEYAVRKKVEELRRSVVELSPDSIITVDTKGVITSCNNAATRMLGYSKDEMVGKHFSKIGALRPKDLPSYSKLFTSILRGRKTEPLELIFYRKDGTPFLAEVRVGLLKEDDKTIGIQAISRDITERKQMEETLRKSEEKFRNIFENASDAMIYLDSSGKILDVNRKAVEVFGGSKKELLGKHFTKLGVFSPRDIPKLSTAFAEGLTGKPTTLNVRIKNKKGQEMLLEGSASRIKLDDKAVTMVIARDVTERNKTEEALKESEKRLRNIIDTSPDAIVWTDTTGKITLVNRKGFELTEFSQKDLIGKNFMDVEALTQESKEKILKAFMKRIEGIDTPPYEVEIAAKSGETIPAELSASPIYERDRIVGTQSIFRDLRERKKAEEALKESEAKFRNLAEQSPNMIFINKKGRIVYANKKCEEIMGYKREEFYSPDFNFLTLIAPESVDIVKSNFSRHIKGEDVAPYEYRLVTKEGKKIDAIITPKLIRYCRETSILGIVTDISERKKAEEAVRHYSERLEELVEERTKELKKAQERLIRSERLAAIGEVATMVGHDLRNPLQSIENATYYLNNELPSLSSTTPIPQKATEMLQIINDSVNYADKIVRDLQDFSATKKPRPKKTNINALVKETLSHVKAPENVKLVTELGHLPRIEVDKDMIKRVFLNLAANGIQAIENKGILKVSTKKTKGFVEICFKDTGVGIPKGNIKKLFTPFFTTKAQGMGVGLPICMKFVENHGGNIEVESEEGKGSTFTVKLPIPDENGGERT